MDWLYCITGGSEFKFPTAWQLLYNVLQVGVRVPNMSQSETALIDKSINL